MSSNFNLNKTMLIFTLLISAVFFTGCTDDEDKKSDGVTVEKYNKLVRKHNTLLKNSNGKYKNLYNKHSNLNDDYTSLRDQYSKLVESKNDTTDKAYETSKLYLDYLIATQSMNEALDQFASNVLLFIEFKDIDKKNNYPTMQKQFETGSERILKVQKILIEQYNSFYKLATNVYEKDTAPLDALQLQADKSELIFGIESQHKALMDIVNKHYTKTGATPKKLIALNAAEKIVGKAKKGSGITVKSDGTIVTHKPQEFKYKALEMGFRHTTVEDSQTMASSMNGIVGMACTNKNLVAVLNNLVSHMKTKANLNGGDLEIALAIDYSGSMDNNIQKVLTDLSSFVSSLANVKNAGRGIKIGITTFGEKGREQINLNLTSDINKVQRVLADLLSDFDFNQHSMDPGEASYYGLAKTADLSWLSQNRQAIVITDEPSYSLQVGDTSFVNSVITMMSNISVYPLMVTLCN